MGQMKNWAIEHDEMRGAATDYMVSVGELKRCEYHDEVYGGANFDLEGSFYARAMNDKKKGINGPVPWADGMAPREYTDLLKEAYEDHPADSCGRCDKIAAE